MVSRISRTIFFVLACLLFAIPGVTPNYARKLFPPAALKQPLSTARPRAIKDYGRLPLLFEANRGQTNARVQFVSRGPGYTLFLTSHQAVLTLAKPVAKPNSPDRLLKMPEVGRQRTTRSAVVRLQLEGANPKAVGIPENEVAAKSNYFIGNDPAKWHSNVPNYKKVRYRNIYPGIDLVYYGNHQQLEHDFVVAPGANPGAITLAVQGAQELHLDRHGNLVMKTKGGKLRLLKPQVYQTADGARRPVSGRYLLKGKNKVGFEVAEYNHHQPLVIDPVLLYSTYLGGSADDAALGIAVDSSGGAYIAGYTSSADFPTRNPFQSSWASGSPFGYDAFVVKLAPDGSLLYSTFLGGTGDDTAYGIAVDSSGAAYLAGQTNSADFPTKNPAQASIGGWQAFVTKLSPDGSALVYSTYLGGGSSAVPLTYGGAIAEGIAVDASDNAYVTGSTNAADFPKQNALQDTYGGGPEDAFVTKLAVDGSAFLYSTYLGGTGDDIGYDIAVDASGEAYVVGDTSSLDFPTKNALQSQEAGATDTFVTKLAADGSTLLYSTYLGGSADDVGLGGAVDTSGEAYVTGYTTSSDFPTKNALQSQEAGAADTFVAKLAADGSTLLYSTYLGGSVSDGANGIAVDSSGDAYVSGGTNSPDFPTKDRIQSGLVAGVIGVGDAFVSELAPDGSVLLFSTYLGGTWNDAGNSIAIDASGNIYMAGVTSTGDFPTKNAFQDSYGGGASDAFVTKIGESSATPVLSATPTTLAFTATEAGSNPSPQAISIGNTGGGTLDWTAAVTSSWLFLDSNSGTAPSTVNASVDISGLAPGTYQDTITVTSKGSTNSPATIAVTLTVAPKPTFSVSASSLDFTAKVGGSNAAAQTLILTNTGTATLNWTATKTQAWLLLGGTNGTTPSNLQVSVNIAGLAVGTYHDTITVTVPGASNSPITIPVTLTITANEVMSLSTPTLTFTATAGGNNPDPQSFTVTASGSDALSWTASKTQSWLALSSASGTAPSTIQVSVNIDGLDAGTYHDTITFTAPDASNSPQTVAVTLTVKAPPDFRVGVGSGGSGSESVNDGSSANYAMAVTPLNGFAGPVSFTCSQLPSLATCSFSHEPLSVSGSNAVPFTVMIETTATTTSGMTTGFGTGDGGGMATGLLILAGISLLLAVMLKRRKLALATLLLGAAVFVGCGGGASAPVSTTKPGTPTGTYTVVLTATSGSITHTANLTLTVK